MTSRRPHGHQSRASAGTELLCLLCGLLLQLLLLKLDGRVEEEVSFRHVALFSPPKGPCLILMLGARRWRRAVVLRVGALLRPHIGRGKYKTGVQMCPSSLASSIKIGTKSHVLVPSQSQGDAHGREKAIML